MPKGASGPVSDEEDEEEDEHFWALLLLLLLGYCALGGVKLCALDDDNEYSDVNGEK